MSEMVERVVQAAIAALREQEEVYLREEAEPPTFMLIDGNVDLVAVIRAAIEAMREPTEAMIAAGYGAMEDWRLRPSEPDVIWRAMIDAALKD